MASFLKEGSEISSLDQTLAVGIDQHIEGFNNLLWSFLPFPVKLAHKQLSKFSVCSCCCIDLLTYILMIEINVFTVKFYLKYGNRSSLIRLGCHACIVHEFKRIVVSNSNHVDIFITAIESFESQKSCVMDTVLHSNRTADYDRIHSSPILSTLT